MTSFPSFSIYLFIFYYFGRNLFFKVFFIKNNHTKYKQFTTL